MRLIAHGFAHCRPLLIPVPPPSGFQLALFALVLLTGMTCKGRRRGELLVLLCIGIVLGEVATVRAGSPSGSLRATFLDVGQGDAALVDLPDGEAILIDGGGLVGSPVDTGTRVVAPTLRDRRRSRLAAVVLSPSASGSLHRAGVRARRCRRRGAVGHGARRARRGPRRLCGAAREHAPGPRAGPAARDPLRAARDGWGGRRGPRPLSKRVSRSRPERQLTRPAHHVRRALVPLRRRLRARGGARPPRARARSHPCRRTEGWPPREPYVEQPCVHCGGRTRIRGHLDGGTESLRSPAPEHPAGAQGRRDPRVPDGCADGAVMAWTDGARLDVRSEAGATLRGCDTEPP